MTAKKKKTPTVPIADLDAPPSQAQCVAMLRGENDLFWHGRISRLFAEAGFEARYMERDESPPIWRVALTRTTFELAPDNHSAVEQLRNVLRRGNIKVPCDTFHIVDRRGNDLNIVFMKELGAPGLWQGRLRPAKKRKKQGELWPAPR
jgi:hypothetical protein